MVFITINRDSSDSLTRQIYSQLQGKILKGELAAHTKLPSSREMAEELKVARNIVIDVYEQLIAEGYLESRRGSGTFIAEGAYFKEYKNGSVARQSIKVSPQPEADLIDFISGLPDFKSFPREIWSKIERQVYYNTGIDAFNYPNTQGVLELRETLSRFLLKTKGIYCDPEQIFVLSGSTQAFYFANQLLNKEEKTIILEDPAYNPFRDIGVPLFPVSVDEKGMMVDRIPEDLEAAFISVIPSHQYPTGKVLSIQRRLKLIEIASEKDIYIVENDYDREFRYSGQPISPIYALAPEKVIHIGTFSETIFPSLRLGYMVLPQKLIQEGRRLARLIGLTCSSINQFTLAGFIDEGHFERHILRMKKIYKKKREHIISCLTDIFGDEITVTGDSTGLFVVVEFKTTQFNGQLLSILEEKHLRVCPFEDLALERTGKYDDKILLGYGHLSHKEIQTGILRLKECVDLAAGN